MNAELFSKRNRIGEGTRRLFFAKQLSQGHKTKGTIRTEVEHQESCASVYTTIHYAVLMADSLYGSYFQGKALTRRQFLRCYDILGVAGGQCKTSVLNETSVPTVLRGTRPFWVLTGSII
jgi:hypothetical protein